MKTALALLLLVLLAAAGAGAWLWYSLTRPYKNFPSDGVFVTVPRGASCRTVAQILERNGVVRSVLAFKLYCRRNPKRGLQAGEYFFDHARSSREVFTLLANGRVFEKAFTVREGQTMFDIAHELAAAKFMTEGEFLEAAHDPALVHNLAPEAQTLEGFLFPATYHLTRHPAPADLAAEMVRKLKEEWSRIAPEGTGGGRSLFAVVTLASLVERETPRPEERPLVASVFDNRQRIGMPMQCDPTVIYALERVGYYNGRLTSEDLRFNSPYNTYRYRGMPPGPIGNPGEASLRAALAPAKSPYLYFVANTQGGHFFGATLAEHNRNVRRYHRLMAGLPPDPDPEPEPPARPAKKRPPHKGHSRKPVRSSAR